MRNQELYKPIVVIGAGLAGCEAAHQLVMQSIPVRLYEMKRIQMSPAHHSFNYAELVCSNSFRSNQAENAVGLLKEELRRFNSLIISKADRHAVPAGAALAVDREAFSLAVTKYIKSHPLIEICEKRVDSISEVADEECICIVASGPLTADELWADIEDRLGSKSLHFFDAAAPLIEADSINYEIVFRQSRYDKGTADYLNCPMNEEEYKRFYEALLNAELAEVKDFDKVFEGCMPIETMAKRGSDTMRYGMLKPVGLRDPRTGKRPFAVVQLRQDNAASSLYNMVGFQTRLKFSEQRRVFRMVPGLEKAEFARYGVMHRNQFIKSPGLLNAGFSMIKEPRILFAGQMTGVEGYVESCASGLIAGRTAANLYKGKASAFILPKTTMMGALQHYIAEAEAEYFQPMNVNYGLVPPLTEKVKKAQKKASILQRAREAMDLFIASQV